MEITERSFFVAGAGQSHGSHQRPEWTVKEYAKLEKVATSTVRRWIDKDALNVRRTPGGGIRILGTK